MSTLATIDESVAPPLLQPGSRGSSRLALIVSCFIIALYLLLQNPFWVRHGDSEVFLSLARNIAQGRGYQFNGEPVVRVPQGWPYVLAGAMKISPQIWFLKLLPMTFMLGFLLLSYRLLLECATPLIAGLCIVTAAILEPVFPLSYMFFSDSLFALLAVAAVAMALRISSGRDSWANIVVLILLCSAAAAVREAALPWFAVLAGALLHGELWPRANRRWLAVLLAAAATVIVFLSLRQLRAIDPSQLDPRYDTFLAGTYDIVNRVDPVERFLNFGQWLGGLLWQPAQTFRFSRPADSAVGWLLSILILLFVIVPAIRRRRWAWLGGALYVIALGANWPDAVTRYIVPLAPFVVLASYEAIVEFSEKLRHARIWLRPLGLNLFFASVLGLNGATYLIEASAMHATHFYERYQGGLHKSLIESAFYLNEHPDDMHEIAISQRIENIGKISYSDGYRRALNFLTNRSIINVPQELCREPNADLIAWLTQHHVRYYLYQPPVWAIGHFAFRTHDGQIIESDDTAWHLYEIKDGQALRIRPGVLSGWPVAVPVLDARH
ncbi:MAG TPA: hypothetical protein VHD56_09030 [Tepidisphaeraceae bacterium]|nr:hypothetical protein [Tepidisphaeraceae bacterium]